jgi:predicted phosphodiesterase
MKLQVISDIHLEFDPFKIEKTAPILVVAGDVCEYKHRDKFVSFFEGVSENFDHVIYVLGNHEFYNGDIFQTSTNIKKDLATFNNIHCLDNSTVELDGVTFIGSTLWTDFNAGNDLAMIEAKFNMMDFKVIKNGNIRFTVEDCLKLNQIARDFLFTELKKNHRKKVIVTHHLPDMICVNKRWNNPISMLLNYSFANTGLLDGVIEYEPDLWICGHTHDVVDITVHKTRIVCNPKGYRTENPHFENNKIVNI